MKKDAFSLVELLIAVAIIGILAAAVMPRFRNHILKAKSSAAKQNLQTLRSVIELYAGQHDGLAPGYRLDISDEPHWNFFVLQVIISKTNSEGQPGSGSDYPFGPYLRSLPKNPFNKSASARIIANNKKFPTEASGSEGWIYKPATKQIKLNHSGTDIEGISYFDY